MKFGHVTNVSKERNKMKKVIKDGNIYYITPCINNCGIKWLTSDEIDIDGCVCSNCSKED